MQCIFRWCCVFCCLCSCVLRPFVFKVTADLSEPESASWLSPVSSVLGGSFFQSYWGLNTVYDSALFRLVFWWAYIALSAQLCACLSRVWLFATPWTAAHQAPLSVGFLRQECWSQLLFPPPGDLPDPEMEPQSSALQVILCHWAVGEAVMFALVLHYTCVTWNLPWSTTLSDNTVLWLQLSIGTFLLPFRSLYPALFFILFYYFFTFFQFYSECVGVFFAACGTFCWGA